MTEQINVQLGPGQRERLEEIRNEMQAGLPIGVRISLAAVIRELLDEALAGRDQRAADPAA
jgi:hypothetical protein